MSGIFAIVLVFASVAIGFLWFRNKLARSTSVMEKDYEIGHARGNAMDEHELKELKQQKRKSKNELPSSDDEEDKIEEVVTKKSTKKCVKKPK